ncbi:MAG: caspase family protein, partial [Dolichospermum sp.]
TERLRRSRADNVVLLLDACREEGSRSGLGQGRNNYQGVITFYSCAANQKSWEIHELQHGSFTHTLLTGLRLHGEANCATVERLDRYLNSAVPQLNTRYQKPIQNPYLKAEPPYKMYYILLEQSATMR